MGPQSAKSFSWWISKRKKRRSSKRRFMRMINIKHFCSFVNHPFSNAFILCCVKYVWTQYLLFLYPWSIVTCDVLFLVTVPMASMTCQLLYFKYTIWYIFPIKMFVIVIAFTIQTWSSVMGEVSCKNTPWPVLKKGAHLQG